VLNQKRFLGIGLLLILLCMSVTPAAAQTNDVDDWLAQFCAGAGAELSGCQHQAGQTAAVVQDIAQELNAMAQICADEIESGNLTAAECGQVMLIYTPFVVEMACYEGEQANGTIPACQALDAVQSRWHDSTLYSDLGYCASTADPHSCVVKTLLFSAYGSAALVCGLAEDTHPLPACQNVSDLMLAIGESEMPQKIEQCQAWVESGKMSEEQCQAYITAFATMEMYAYCGITTDDPVRNSPGCQGLALHQEGDGLVLATAQTWLQAVQATTP